MNTIEWNRDLFFIPKIYNLPLGCQLMRMQSQEGFEKVVEIRFL